MDHEKIYDCAILGGGLAGLTLSIQLAKAGYQVILFEKEEYPFHKVCGEYISMESWNFLESLGLNLANMNLPFIKKLIVTAPNGNMLKENMEMGGFGISRYKLDFALKNIAVQNGVVIKQKCKVGDALLKDNIFHLQTSEGLIKSLTCCAAFGKRSNLDVKWGRKFIKARQNKLNNYIGIKYHIKTEFASDTIALHNFKDGYCGISKIEDDRYCLCYLTNAENLRRNQNSIPLMEKNILSQNPHLKKILESSQKLYAQPLSISQVSFQQKTQIENHILMIGDAAGMITPLCGNGMSMAMHGSKIACKCILGYLTKNLSQNEMEMKYRMEWNQTFGNRLKAGRMIQRFFGKIWMTNFFISFLKKMPALTKWLISQTHGGSF